MTIRWPALRTLAGEAKLLWWSLGLILVVPLLISRTPASKDNVLLYSGMVLELAGLIVVALGLSELRRLFGRPPLRSDITGWLRRIPDAFRLPRTFTGTGSVQVSAFLAGSGRAVIGVGEDASPEQRMNALERNLANLRSEFDSKAAELQNALASANERIDRESRERQTSLQDISHKLEVFAVGDLHLEFVGLLWVALGMIETNIPAKIAGGLQAMHLL